MLVKKKIEIAPKDHKNTTGTGTILLNCIMHDHI